MGFIAGEVVCRPVCVNHLGSFVGSLEGGALASATRSGCRIMGDGWVFTGPEFQRRIAPASGPQCNTPGVT
jgi:hypothetical protein